MIVTVEVGSALQALREMILKSSVESRWRAPLTSWFGRIRTWATPLATASPLLSLAVPWIWRSPVGKSSKRTGLTPPPTGRGTERVTKGAGWLAA
ncbi:hypothetical protein D3C86_2016900 [compost metagenome]